MKEKTQDRIVVIGCDHRGKALAKGVVELLALSGYTLIECIPDSLSIDYPLVAKEVALRLQAGKASFGILICGTGVGMAIAANRFVGVRAAIVHDQEIAFASRRHNDANVAVFAGERIAARQATALFELFVKTPFDGDAAEGARHKKRVAMLDSFAI